MTKILTRSLLVLFACWLMLGQTGLAWKSATCVFTGNVNYGWGKRVTCCQKSVPQKQDQFSRASCCTYDQFQVKLAAEQSFKSFHYAFDGFVPANLIHDSFGKRFLFEPTYLSIELISPPPPSVKRAFIQVYLI